MARKLVVGRSDPERPRKIDRLNRVVLPGEVLQGLGLRKGDYVRVRLDGKNVRISKVIG